MPESHRTMPLTDGASEVDEQPEKKDDGSWVTILFFAGAREAAGTGRARARAEGRSVAELLAELVSTYGEGLKSVLATCAVWVNGSPASGATLLAEGDEVAVLPPVSGGCGTLGSDVPERRRSLQPQLP
jgi:molybdopterin converting factor small subunit